MGNETNRDGLTMAQEQKLVEFINIFMLLPLVITFIRESVTGPSLCISTLSPNPPPPPHPAKEIAEFSFL